MDRFKMQIEPPTVDTIEVQELYGNGRPYVRVLLPRLIVHAFAALLYACIVAQRGARRRHGSADLVANCITGMAGQLAVLFWLRSIGLNSAMLLPRRQRDPGYDVVIRDENVQVKIEVKTSCCQDDRSFLAMTGGDRIPLGKRSLLAPKFIFMCVCPKHVPVDSRFPIDIVATVPSESIKQWKKPVTAPPGVRLRDVDPRFNTIFFSDTFNAAVDEDVSSDFGTLCTPNDVRDVLHWAVESGLVLDGDESSPSLHVQGAFEAIADGLSRMAQKTEPAKDRAEAITVRSDGYYAQQLHFSDEKYVQ